jgi:hypothetical protein
MNADKMPNEPESPNRPLALSIALIAGFLAAVLRIVPHPPNFSSIGALGLFGGARLQAWQAYLLPLGIMVLSDISLWVLTGFDPLYSVNHQSRLYVYAGFIIYVLIGRCLRKQDSLKSVVLAATLGGLQFFFITNFCTWLFQPFDPSYSELPEVFRYSRDWNGLVTCFVMALPFYNPGEIPFVDHPFMLFTDHRLALPWTIAGDIFFTSLYMSIYANLAQKTPAMADAALDANIKVLS